YKSGRSDTKQESRSVCYSLLRQDLPLEPRRVAGRPAVAAPAEARRHGLHRCRGPALRRALRPRGALLPRWRRCNWAGVPRLPAHPGAVPLVAGGYGGVRGRPEAQRHQGVHRGPQRRVEPSRRGRRRARAVHLSERGRLLRRADGPHRRAAGPAVRPAGEEGQPRRRDQRQGPAGRRAPAVGQLGLPPLQVPHGQGPAPRPPAPKRRTATRGRRARARRPCRRRPRAGAPRRRHARPAACA
ncbi:unnamed protein product, partial [Prorocentrum cordatum]